MHTWGMLKVGGIILGVATTAFGGISEIVGFTDLKLGSGWISIGGFAIFAIVMGWIILSQLKRARYNHRNRRVRQNVCCAA